MHRFSIAALACAALFGCVAGPDAPEDDYGVGAPSSSEAGEIDEADEAGELDASAEAVRAACGGMGQQCCPNGVPYAPVCREAGTACTSQNFLLPGVCVSCGGLGEPCCEQSYKCGAFCTENNKPSNCCVPSNVPCTEGTCTKVGTDLDDTKICK